ncbi:MAG: recombinase family protein [Rhizobiaceae bacterium]
MPVIRRTIREASIEDQFRLCRERAGQERWEIVGSYEDAAISGSSTILRPGIQRLMRDAKQGGFNILLAEALDKISRDQADVATLYKHLKFAGVSIVTLAEGEISELHVGLKGAWSGLTNHSSRTDNLSWAAANPCCFPTPV